MSEQVILAIGETNWLPQIEISSAAGSADCLCQVLDPCALLGANPHGIGQESGESAGIEPPRQVGFVQDCYDLFVADSIEKLIAKVIRRSAGIQNEQDEVGAIQDFGGFFPGGLFNCLLRLRQLFIQSRGVNQSH